MPWLVLLKLHSHVSRQVVVVWIGWSGVEMEKDCVGFVHWKGSIVL